jgi:large subunit ribosomal protein L25
MKRQEILMNRRFDFKKGCVRKLRRREILPGVVYGIHSTVPVSVPIKDIVPLLKQSEMETLTLNFKIVDDNDGSARMGIGLVKDIQKHPVTDAFLHFDVMEVQMDKTVTIEVHTALVGETEAVKIYHGVIEHSLRVLTVECLPDRIPSHIDIDISMLQIGDNIKVEDLTLPQGVKVMDDPNQVIVSVLAPLKEEIVEEEIVEEEEVVEEEKVEEEQVEEEPGEDSPSP